MGDPFIRFSKQRLNDTAIKMRGGCDVESIYREECQELNPAKRNNYFLGKVLTEEDLRNDQFHHRTADLALDPWGREIVVSEPVQFEVGELGCRDTLKICWTDKVPIPGARISGDAHRHNSNSWNSR